MSSFDEPPHPDVADQEYGNESEPVKDQALGDGTDGAAGNTTIGNDEKAELDEDNIIKERTRNARPEGGYKEPGDNEGLPTDE